MAGTKRRWLTTGSSTPNVAPSLERTCWRARIWANDEAEFSGEHVNFDSSWSWPKPVQPGGPKVLLGGAAGPKTIQDIVEFCDGWMPISGRHDLTGPIEEVRQAAEDAGRDPATLEFGQFGTPGKPDVLESLEAAGVSRAVVGSTRRTRYGPATTRLVHGVTEMTDSAGGVEMLDIFDDMGRHLGVKPRDQVHLAGDWHRVFHCQITTVRNDIPSLILQRLSQLKAAFPGLLDLQRRRSPLR